MREVGNTVTVCAGVRVRVLCATEIYYELDTLAVAQGKIILRPNSLWRAESTQSVCYRSDFPVTVLVCESWRLDSRYF